MWGKVSESCDVYSFGILLLEIISGRKPLEKLPGGVKRDIVQWITPYVQKDAFDHIVDSRLRGKFELDQLELVVMVGMRCVDSHAENRPSMVEVVQWLKGSMSKKEIKQVVEEEEEFAVEEDAYTPVSTWRGRKY